MAPDTLESPRAVCFGTQQALKVAHGHLEMLCSIRSQTSASDLKPTARSSNLCCPAATALALQYIGAA